MTSDAIRVCKACENNLDSVSCSIPRNKLVVVTGPSGSGKTSLVFNTIYAEAKRRFLETLIPTKARLFGELEHPDVESISGLSFVSALGLSGAVSRYATVATLTQVYDYLRLVFFHRGVPHCLHCNEPLYKHTRKEMLSKVSSLAQSQTVYILAPLGEMEFAKLKTKYSELSSQGFTRVRVDGKLLRLDEKILPSGSNTYNLELFVDVIPPGDVSGLDPRIIDALDIALSLGSGNVIVNVVNGIEQQMQFSEVLRCGRCDSIQKPIELSSFTYYNSTCACSVCAGVGYVEDKEKDSEIAQERICTECLGARVGKEAANYHLLARSFGEVFLGTIQELVGWSEGSSNTYNVLPLLRVTRSLESLRR